MSTNTCPNGHVSTSSDYCDTCGAPMDPTLTPPASSSTGSNASPAASGPDSASANAASATTSATLPCPNCAVANLADALFCEACGYDFTTGTMPRSETPTNPLDLGASPAGAAVPGSSSASPPESVAPPVAVEWVAEVWVDPDWYADQESDDPCPSPGLPIVVPLQTQSLMIGRR